MYALTLGLVSILCFWRLLLKGWTPGILFQAAALFLTGILALRLYKKAGKSDKASLLAAAVFLVSVAPQGGPPKMYFGALALAFAVSGYRSSKLRRRI